MRRLFSLHVLLAAIFVLVGASVQFMDYIMSGPTLYVHNVDDEYRHIREATDVEHLRAYAANLVRARELSRLTHQRLQRMLEYAFLGVTYTAALGFAWLGFLTYRRAEVQGAPNREHAAP